MNTVEYFKERFDQLQAKNGSNGLGALQQAAFDKFNKMGIPTVKHEEWRYTRISNLFNKAYEFPVKSPGISEKDLNAIRLPGYEQANELIFINGIFSDALSI